MARTKGSANRKHNISRLIKTPVTRDAQMNFRCTAAQKEMINRISIETHESVADVILKAVHKYALTNYKMVQTNIAPAEINEVFE